MSEQPDFHKMFDLVLHGPIKKLEELLKNVDVNTIVHDTDGYGLLHIAATFNRTNEVKLLLSKGARINATDSEGETPLDYAVTGGHKESVNALLVNGANPNIQNIKGETSLFHVNTKHPDFVGITTELLTAGASDTILNNKNQTASNTRNKLDKIIKTAEQIIAMRRSGSDRKSCAG